MKINGLELPTALQVSLKNGKWMSRGDKYSSRWHDKNDIELFKKYFPLVEDPLPQLFDYDGMVNANALWASSQDVISFYAGKANADHPPGNVDPQHTVIIGASEPDSPIALDYRTKIPRVVYFCDVEDSSIWVEVFKNIDELLAALNLLSDGQVGPEDH